MWVSWRLEGLAVLQGKKLRGLRERDWGGEKEEWEGGMEGVAVMLGK